MRSWTSDVRAALRAFAATPIAVCVAVGTLALGLGATTTMVGVVHAALFRPVPFTDPESLVMVYLTRATPARGLERLRSSFREFDGLRTNVSSFDAVASFTRTTVTIRAPDAEQIDGEIVSPDYFRVLRIRPMVGPGFRPSTTAAGNEPSILLSAGLWRSRFSADSAVVGRPLLVNGLPLTVAGVLPDGFSGLSGRADVWIPAGMAPQLTYAEYLTTPQHFIAVVARLGPRETVGRVNQELAVVGPQIANSGATSTGPETWSALAVPIDEARVDPSVRRSAWLLLAATGCVLLIVSANTASLLVARVRQRRRELAVRRALGARRWHLARHALIESGLLVGAGASLGLLIAAWGLRIVAAKEPSPQPSSQNGFLQVSGFATPGLDGAVVTAAMAVAAIVLVLLAAIPAAASWRTDVTETLKDDSRTSSGRSRALMTLTVIEIGLAVLLATGADAFLQGAIRAEGLRTGFVSRDVLTFRLVPPASRYPPSAGPAILERLLTAIQRAPGVERAAVDRCTPLEGCALTTLFQPERPDVPAAAAPVVERHYVSPDYFRVLGIPLRAGRLLSDADRGDRLSVVVIDECAARQFWPGENPLGRHVWFGPTTGISDAGHPVEVVGIVGDVKFGPIDEPVRPDFYTSYRQFAFPDTTVIAAVSRPGAVLPAIRAAVGEVDRDIAVSDALTLDDRVARVLSPLRFDSAAWWLFTATAILLAMCGVYGLASFAVSSRVRELGIRAALGADAGRIRRLVVGEALRLAMLGSAVGGAAAIAAGRLVPHLVAGTTTAAPAAIAIGAAVLTVAAGLAAWRPAARASRVDPARVLQSP